MHRKYNVEGTFEIIADNPIILNYGKLRSREFELFSQLHNKHYKSKPQVRPFRQLCWVGKLYDDFKDGHREVGCKFECAS